MHKAFLKTICENPRDLLPRQIYADWLEEQGDPRAEYIRLQCELAAGNFSEPERHEHSRRAMQLADRYRCQWDNEIWDSLGQIPGLWQAITNPLYGQQSFFYWEYHAGFPAHLELYPEVFLQFWPAIREVMPVRNVCLRRAWRELEEIVESPHLETVECLELSLPGEMTEAGAKPLCRSRYVRNLPRLHVSGLVRISRPAWKLCSRLPNLYWEPARVHHLNAQPNPQEAPPKEPLAPEIVRVRHPGTHQYEHPLETFMRRWAVRAMWGGIAFILWMIGYGLFTGELSLRDWTDCCFIVVMILGILAWIPDLLKKGL